MAADQSDEVAKSLQELAAEAGISIDDLEREAMAALQDAQEIEQSEPDTFAQSHQGKVQKEIEVHRDGKIIKQKRWVNPEEAPKTEQPKDEQKPTSQPSAEVDPDVNRPSRPENRHPGNKPPVKEWVDPPQPRGATGGGPAKRPKGKRSQTALGDKAEESATNLGFRSILPPGRRMNKDVKTEGSSIDREYDHSGRAYEIKMCKTTATEYRAKPKKQEIDDKYRYAKMHGLEAFTMIAVMDEKARTIHYYVGKEPGILTKKLSKDSFDFVGTSTF